jgi:hypothetical protein
LFHFQKPILPPSVPHLPSQSVSAALLSSYSQKAVFFLNTFPTLSVPHIPVTAGLLWLLLFQNPFPPLAVLPLSVPHIPDGTGLLLFQNPFPSLTVPHIAKALGCYSFRFCHSLYLTFPTSLGLLLFQILPLSVPHIPHVTMAATLSDSATRFTSHFHRHWAALTASLSEYVSSTCCNLHSCWNMFPPLSVPHWAASCYFQNPFPALTVPHIPDVLGC